MANSNQWYANNTKNNDDYAFATQHEAHSKAMCKWIMDSWQQSTRFSIGRHLTHTIISLVSVHLGDDSVVEMKGMNVIIVEVLVKNQNKRICIKDDLYKQICSQ